ncbi:MAG: hypothetical protein V3W18_09515 [candidate division Zixibacteria bacterium]
MVFRSAIALLLLSSAAFADEYRSKANDGFDYYKNGEYDKAVEYYRQAGILMPDKALPKVGKGAAMYRSNDLEGAIKEFESAASTGNKRLAADMRYNIGNSKYKTEDYKGAIESYVEALKLNSDEIDYKHNLEMALSQLQQQEQQQEQNQDGDKDGDQKQDQQDQQKQQNQDENQQKNQDKDQQNQQDSEQDKKQNQQQLADEQEMSEEEAENLLARFEEDEKEIQEKLKQINIRGGSSRDW